MVEREHAYQDAVAGAQHPGDVGEALLGGETARAIDLVSDAGLVELGDRGEGDRAVGESELLFRLNGRAAIAGQVVHADHIKVYRDPPVLDIEEDLRLVGR